MKKAAVFICLLLFLLTGCWDQTMLKDLNIVVAAGYDYAKGHKVKTTVVVPIIKKGASGAQGGGGPVGLSAPYDQVLSSVSATPRSARIKINNELFESYNAAKLLNLGFGEKLAKTHIFPYLDLFIRDPKGSLNANLFVADGQVGDILKYTNKLNPKVGNYLNQLILSSVRATTVPKMNIESICANLLDPGSDFVVPFIKLDKKQKIVQLKGLALFHGDRYTGEYLTPEEGTLFLLIKGEKGKTARQTFKVFNNQHTELENYVNVNVQKASPKLKIKISPAGEVNATYDVKLSVAVEEYPHDRLANQKQRQLLTKRLNAVFTKRAEKMIEKLQRNNCDAFGLGTRLNAFHHDYWIKSDWNEDYKKVKIKVNIKTVLLQQGAIN